LATVSLCLILLAGSFAVAAPEAEMPDRDARLPGVDDKRLLPDDIYVEPRVVLEAYSIGDDHVTGYQQLDKPPDALLTETRRAMLQNGWEATVEQETPDGWLLIWQKDDRTCTVEVVAYEGDSELWLRCSGGR